MVKSNLDTCNRRTSLIDGFINYLIDVITNMNHGSILSVTKENVAVMLGEIVVHYSAKQIFSLITGVEEFRTLDQQDVSEALTLIFVSFQQINPNMFDFST